MRKKHTISELERKLGPKEQLEIVWEEDMPAKKKKTPGGHVRVGGSSEHVYCSRWNEMESK